MNTLLEFCNSITPIKLSVTKDETLLKWKELLFQTTKFLDFYDNPPLALRYYCILNNITEIPNCICGNKVLYKKDDPKLGFAQFCSPTCSRSNKDLNKDYQKYIQDYDWLYNQRIILQKSKEQIAKELGCSISPINKWIKKHNIENRKSNVRNTKINPPPKEELENLYFNDMLTLVDIGIKYDVSNVTVKKWFKEYNINLICQYEKWIDNNFLKYNLDRNKMSDHSYLNEICKNSTYGKLSKTHFNNMTIGSIIRHFKRIGFSPKFENNNCSIGELEIGDYIQNLGFDIIRSDRKILNGYELDIYIPNKNLAIEFNGLYYHHSEQYKHASKYFNCKNNNITLLNFYEDEWYNNSNKVKSIIKYHLNLNTKIKVEYIKKINTQTAKVFYSDNYIKNCINGDHYGLYYNNILYAITTIRNNIIYYNEKINYTIINGLNLIVQHIKNKYNKLYLLDDLRFQIHNNEQNFVIYIHPKFEWTNPSSLTRHNQKFDQLTEKYVKIWDCGYNLYKIK